MQDGNVHCHVDNVSRKGGKTGARVVVVTAAYVSGQRLWSEIEQRMVTFDMREDVVFSEVLLPDGAPGWAADREALWNRVDLSAKRKDARLAKTVVAAIARDLPAAMRPDLLRAFAAPFVAIGCIADIAIHEDGTDHNPHVHILLTTRRLTADGFGDKLTALEQRSFVKSVRQRWADLTNEYLKQAGSALRVDHRSYKARGIEAVPTVHRGPNELERREKREHARRAREEQDMAKPTFSEQREYPLLAARETWPPEPEASPEMTVPERDEHHRYWEDRKLDRLETDYQAEPERSEPERAEQTRRDREPPSRERPWYDQALDRARQESAPDFERKFAERRELAREVSRDEERAQSEYDAGVFERARSMKRSHEEHAVLEAVREEPAEVRKMVQDMIMHDRMQFIRGRDREAMLEQMPPQIRAQVEVLRPDVPERHRDLPEPGPERELTSRRELDRARDAMLREYQRDEPDHEEPER